MPKEFEFIDQIRRKFALDRIGDDCAVLPKNATHETLITADLLVEEIDFRRQWMIPEFLGHKALAVSLSDIAAMGGNPLYSLLSIGIPADVWTTDFVDEFYEGYFKLARKFKVELIGGDVSRTPDKIVIDSTVIGEVEKGKAVLRSGAKPGDLIFVTGELGGARAGLKLLEENPRIERTFSRPETVLTGDQLFPFPKIAEGRFLSGRANSMIDISDGFASDLGHICEASQVGARIYADQIPINKMISAVTKMFSEQLDLALNGGEDFELIFTVDPGKNSEKINDRFFCVGSITANVGIIELIDSEKSTVLTPGGYQHF